MGLPLTRYSPDHDLDYRVTQLRSRTEREYVSAAPAQ